MASKHRTILVFGSQPIAIPPDAQRATQEATAALVEGLVAKALAEDDLIGRLCASLVVAKIRRGGQR